MMTKAMKIGSSERTDSFTPRRFITTIRKTTSAQTQSFHGAQETGRKLKMASAPLAIEIETVST